MKTNNFLFFHLFALSLITGLVSCQEDPNEEILDPGPIVLNCNDFRENDQTLVNDPNRAVDYYVPCVMEIYANITIEEGTVIEFADDAGFQIDESAIYGRGSLRTLGSSGSDETTLFTAENKVEGAWKGVFYNTPSTQNQLAYVEIAYAGGGAFNSNNDQGAVIVYANAKLNMNNVFISNSGSYGIHANYHQADLTMGYVEVSGCANAPILITQSFLGKIPAVCDLTGNDEPYIRVEVNTEAIEESITVENPGIPYRVFPYDNSFRELLIADGVTTVSSGVVLEFTDETGMYVDDNGTLDITGGNTLLTGTTKSAGSWRGIYFQFTQGANRLNDLVIEYAGSTSDGYQGAIHMWGDPIVAVQNVEFSNIAGCAVIDRPKGPMDAPNPNFSDNGGNTYTAVSGGNYCKES